MLKHRIIPVLLHDGYQVVKPISFNRPYRKLGPLEQYLNVMEERNVDELVLIDIEATPEGREPNYDNLRLFTNRLFCPITYVGGINSIESIRHCLECGADKVGLKTSFELIPRAAEKFGKQAIVGIIDNTDEGWDYLVERCRTLELLGAGELLLGDIALDGTMQGYNQKAISEVSSELSIPVVALGGCSGPADMGMALDNGASAVGAGSLFLYTETTPRDCAIALQSNGYDVRLSTND